MVFSSPIFLFLFLPVLLGVYYSVRAGSRNLLLMLGSLGFYVWGEGRYAVVLLVSVAINYVFGLLIDRWNGRRRAAVALAAAVAINLLLIGVFKYANFLVDNLNVGLVALGLRPWALGPVHLPLGISFFTFQALSYVIDVYRRDVPVQRGVIDFALYKTLFPQLIAGPIVRYRDVAAELAERSTTVDDFALGVRRFIIGLAKKMLLANSVAATADAIFAVPAGRLTAGLAWLGIVCYALQIYFDFCGYSDMAIGLGRMFGFTFPENFRYPYAASSITDFWRRWHISLSSWFRDYLYVPLGGNRRGRARLYFNLVFVFFLCGLWHGASWNFIVWGVFHGAFLVLERLGLGKRVEAAPAPLRLGYVWLVVLVGWVFFRADTLPHALGYLRAMSGLGRSLGVAHDTALYWNRELMLAMAAGLVAIFPLRPVWQGLCDRLRGAVATRRPVALGVSAGLAVVDVAAHAGLMFACVTLLAVGTHNPFIYFRF